MIIIGGGDVVAFLNLPFKYFEWLPMAVPCDCKWSCTPFLFLSRAFQGKKRAQWLPKHTRSSDLEVYLHVPQSPQLWGLEFSLEMER